MMRRKSLKIKLEKWKKNWGTGKKSKWEGDRKRQKERSESGGVKNRLKEVEKMLGKKGQKERKRNIAIRGVKVKERGRREAVKKIMRPVWAKVEIK